VNNPHGRIVLRYFKNGQTEILDVVSREIKFSHDKNTVQKTEITKHSGGTGTSHTTWAFL
jgi:hypothetical protein